MSPEGVLLCIRAFVHCGQTMLGSGNPESEVLNPKSEQLAFDQRVPGFRFHGSRFRSVGGASVRRFRHEFTNARMHETRPDPMLYWVFPWEE